MFPPFPPLVGITNFVIVFYLCVCPWQGGPLKSTVTGVEMFKKILDNGQVFALFTDDFQIN